MNNQTLFNQLKSLKRIKPDSSWKKQAMVKLLKKCQACPKQPPKRPGSGAGQSSSSKLAQKVANQLQNSLGQKLVATVATIGVIAAGSTSWVFLNKSPAEKAVFDGLSQGKITPTLVVQATRVPEVKGLSITEPSQGGSASAIFRPASTQPITPTPVFLSQKTNDSEDDDHHDDESHDDEPEKNDENSPTATPIPTLTIQPSFTKTPTPTITVAPTTITSPTSTVTATPVTTIGPTVTSTPTPTSTLAPSPTPMTEKELCQADPHGIWKEFCDPQADYCQLQNSCTGFSSCYCFYSCDCGPYKCWNGEKCVFNVQSTPSPTLPSGFNSSV